MRMLKVVQPTSESDNGDAEASRPSRPLLEVGRDPGLHRLSDDLSVPLSSVSCSETCICDIKLRQPGVGIAVGDTSSPVFSHPAVVRSYQSLKFRASRVASGSRSIAECGIDIEASLIVGSTLIRAHLVAALDAVLPSAVPHRSRTSLSCWAWSNPAKISWIVIVWPFVTASSVSRTALIC